MPRDAQCKPWGAGLCLTRRVANFYRQLVADLGITAVFDRRGRRLFSGGDDVFTRAATQIDMGFGVFPELRVTHLIPADRLSKHIFFGSFMITLYRMASWPMCSTAFNRGGLILSGVCTYSSMR